MSSNSIASGRSTQASGSIGVFAAAAMGIGGMIGAGIFSILGLVGQSAGSAAWLSFLGAGILALFCGHSFAKLGATFPSAGGPVSFLIRGLGNNILSGSLNLLLWFGYVLALALYTSAFSAYAAALILGTQGGASATAWLQPSIAVGVVVLFLLLNIVGSAAVGKAEGVIVAVKLLILVGFIGVTAYSIQTELLTPSHWKPATTIALSFGVTFLAFEGFGLITNAAGAMQNPNRDLPKSIYLAIGVTIIIYVLVALTTFGNLTSEQVASNKEYALAAAAKPALGQIGFAIMGVAALFSTASAINATLYGGANVGIQVAHDRQLPELFDHTVWHGAKAGLLITAGLVAVLAAIVPLGSIANTGSAIFLVIYAAVCVAHLRLRHETHSSAWPIWIALLGCVGTFAMLMVHLFRSSIPSAIGFFVVGGLSIAAEAIYLHIRGPIRHAAES